MHPSYKGFRELRSEALKNWDVPRNDLPPSPDSILRACAPPFDPPCLLLGTDTASRALLFVHATGAVTTSQLTMFA